MILIRCIGESDQTIFNKNTTLEELGIYYLLEQKINTQPFKLEQILDKYNINSNSFKKKITNLEKVGVLNLNSEMINNDVILTIKMLSIKNEPIKNNEQVNNNLIDLFGLTDLQYKEIIKLSTRFEKLDLALKKTNTIIMLDRMELKQHHFNGNINTKTELYNYLREIYPHELFWEYNIYLSKTDLEVLYELSEEIQLSKEVINTIVDFTLKTTKYGNFNHNFVKKIAYDWKKKEITSIEQAMNQIQEFMNYSKNKNSKYEEPKFEKSNLAQSDNLVLDIEELINNAYN